jgi:hypothetical protein
MQDKIYCSPTALPYVHIPDNIASKEQVTLCPEGDSLGKYFSTSGIMALVISSSEA